MTDATSDIQRRAAAYHEAGHAVIAWMVGFEISSKGVDIDLRQYTGLQIHRYHQTADDYTDNVVAFNMAGWLSEYKDNGLGGFRDDDALQFEIDELPFHDSDIKDGSGNAFEEDGDNYSTFKLLFDLNPDLSDEEAMALYRQHQDRVWKMLHDHDIWSAMEHVASLLIDKGFIEGDVANWEIQQSLPLERVQERNERNTERIIAFK